MASSWLLNEIHVSDNQRQINEQAIDENLGEQQSLQRKAGEFQEPAFTAVSNSSKLMKKRLELLKRKQFDRKHLSEEENFSLEKKAQIHASKALNAGREKSIYKNLVSIHPANDALQKQPKKIERMRSIIRSPQSQLQSL